MRRARWLRATCALAVFLTCAGGCRTESATNRAVVIALPAQTLLAASVFVAEDLGLFEREGLEVQVRNIVGVGSVNAVISGDADFTIGTGATFLRALSQGQRFLAIANMVDRPVVELVVRRDVAEGLGLDERQSLPERARRLKGLTIAVQGVGSMVHAWARYVAHIGGLDVDQDVRIAPMDPPAMLPALKSGVIDGFTTSIPFSTQAVLSGEAVMLASGLTDVPDILPFAYALLYGRPETCSRSPAVCSGLTRAFAAAARHIREQPDLVFEKVVRPRFPAMDSALLEAAWNRARDAHPAEILVTSRQLENAQKVSLGAKLLDPGAALTNFDALYTDRFVR